MVIISNSKYEDEELEYFNDFPYELIRKNSNLIIDTRGRFSLSENIFRA